MSSEVAPTSTARTPGLSVSQMLQLMRLEVDKAIQRSYPITCLMIGLDGFRRDDDAPIRRQIVPQVFGALKTLTSENGIQGLGLTKEHLVVAVFPHHDPSDVQAMGEALIERVMGIQVDDERLVTVSVGVGHNQHPGPVSFEVLLDEAETGLTLANQAGGNKVVQWKDVESELDQLRADIEAQVGQLAAQQKRAEAATETFEEVWGRELIDEIVHAFRHEKDQSPGVVRLTKGVIDIVRQQHQRLLTSSTVQQLTERNSQIDMLERRIQKLTQSLDGTEAELRRVAAMKVVDGGVASMYRDVQGLGDDPDAGQKKEMLAVIFEANFALQKKKDPGADQ